MIRNDLAEIETLSARIAEFCREERIGDDAIFYVQLALDEAVSNTIKYGYGDGAAHQIHIRIGVHERKLTLEIEDDARAFDPLQAPAPDFSLPADERPSGGLGIYLLRKVMDSVEYERTGSKNILRLTKSVDRPAGRPPKL